MSMLLQGVSTTGEKLGVQETLPSNSAASDVAGRQEAYNQAVREGNLGDQETKVGKSIHPLEHLAFVMGAAENAQNDETKYYLVRGALQLCEEKHGNFYHHVTQKFKVSVESVIDDKKFLYLRVEDYFPNLISAIHTSLPQELEQATALMKDELSEQMWTWNNLPLLIANINAAMLTRIERDHDVLRLNLLRQSPMMTEDLLHKIYRRMDEEICGQIRVYLDMMKTPKMTSKTFYEKCLKALEIVNERTKFMGGDWQKEKRAWIFDIAIGLSSRNEFFAKLYLCGDAPQEKKEVIQRKMIKHLNRKLKACALVVVSGEKSKIKSARKKGYRNIEKMKEVMGDDWVADRKKSFMIQFVQKMPSKEGVIAMHSLFKSDLKDDVLVAFQQRAQAIALRRVKAIAYEVAEETISEEDANNKTLTDLFSKNFSPLLGMHWVDQAYKDFSGYIEEARTAIQEGVRPEYLKPEFDPDFMVYTTKSYQKLLGQVSVIVEKDKIDFPSLSYSLKILAATPYDRTAHEAWLAFCDRFGLTGHRVYFEMAQGFLERYENIAKYQNMVRLMLEDSIKYVDFFDGDDNLNFIVTDRFRVAVMKAHPTLTSAIYRDQNWQDLQWYEHRQILAECYVEQVKSKLEEIAGEDLGKVHEYIWRLDGEPQGDPNYGGNHAFDNNLGKFNPAFWAAAKEKLISHIDSL